MPSDIPAGQPLTLFNSASRAIETFTPIDPAMVRLYSCGPTVYDFAHLGNLRAYVFTDTLRRVLNWKGWPTNHVINITDVGHLTSDADLGDDKMELAANRAAKSIWNVARFYTDAFKSDLARLNILPPTLWSVATDHIQDMIGFAQAIQEGGAAYELPTGLYFDTTKVPDYGRLAGAPAGEEVGRIDAVAGKRHASDFAIWRRSPADSRRQMEWASPWGVGAPGWHLECSVMSMKYLGRQFDIHTGGIDHREIHHCNEIAQNQAFTGTAETGANFWMHNNFLIDRGGKMSKSKGGFATLQSLIDRGVHPLAYRLLCLSAHYRSELEFSGEGLGAALTRLKRLVTSIARTSPTQGADWRRPVEEARYGKGASLAWQRQTLEQGLSPAAEALLTKFDQAVSADLNIPAALPLVEEAAGAAKLSADERLRVIASMDLVLGLDLLSTRYADFRIRPAGAAISEPEIEGSLVARAAARASKDFAASDAIRDRLGDMGVALMDGGGSGGLAWEWRVELGE